MAIQSAMRPRILVLTSTFPRWTGDREPPFVFELSKRLANEFDVSVLAPHSSGAAHEEVLDGIQVFRFRYFFEAWQTLAYNGGILANLKSNRLRYLLVPFFLLAECIALLRLLRAHRFDFIHAHWIIPQAAVALMARAVSAQKPLILCTSHGGDLFGLSGRLLTAVKRFIIKRVDKMTVVSEAMRHYAVKIADRSDIEVISMGCDLEQRFTPDQSNRCDQEILFAGRLVEKKGVRYLIDAMQEVVKTHPNARLLIAGDGPERPSLEAQTDQLRLTQNVQFLGPIDNAALRDYYRRAALFAAPSIVAKGGDQEGLGLVFVEALGCECPAVASDLPAIADVVTDGVNGLICRQKDSADLARKISLLLDNPELRSRLGKAGRQYVLGRFDWKIISNRYATLFKNMQTNAARPE